MSCRGHIFTAEMGVKLFCIESGIQEKLHTLFFIMLNYNPLLSPHFIDWWEFSLYHMQGQFLPRVL